MPGPSPPIRAPSIGLPQKLEELHSAGVTATPLRRGTAEEIMAQTNLNIMTLKQQSKEARTEVALKKKHEKAAAKAAATSAARSAAKSAAKSKR